MAITPEDLITKSFKIVTDESGYDRNEVDDFLDELVVELRALYSERDALERQVEQLSASASRRCAPLSPLGPRIPGRRCLSGCSLRRRCSGRCSPAGYGPEGARRLRGPGREG